MSLIVSESKKVELIPEGVQLAVCQALIDVGEQYSQKFDKWSRKVIIVWELPNVKGVDQEGNEYTRKVSREYTAFLGEKTNLEKDLNSWRGKSFTAEERKAFDLKSILNVGCQIQIIHKEKERGTYSEISGIMALPAGMKVESTGQSYVFDIEDESTWSNFGNIPKWIQEKIYLSKEYPTSKLKEFLERNDIVAQWQPVAEGDEKLPF